MTTKITITGTKGFLGKYLSNYLTSQPNTKIYELSSSINKIDNKKAIHNSPGDISSNKSRFGPMLIGSNADIIRKKAIAITKVDFFSR